MKSLQTSADAKPMILHDKNGVEVRPGQLVRAITGYAHVPARCRWVQDFDDVGLVVDIHSSAWVWQLPVMALLLDNEIYDINISEDLVSLEVLS